MSRIEHEIFSLRSLERMNDDEWMDRIRAGKQFSPSIKVGKLLLH